MTRRQIPEGVIDSKVRIYVVGENVFFLFFPATTTRVEKNKKQLKNDKFLAIFRKNKKNSKNIFYLIGNSSYKDVFFVLSYIEKYQLGEIQVNSILELRLQKLTAFGINEIETEIKKLSELIILIL